MLLHLPIALMGVLSPLAVADTVPSFSISRECSFEGETRDVVDRCSKDETEARQKLQKEWAQFAPADKHTCVVESTVGGFASYVDLLTCLEMSNDVRKEDNSARASANQGSRTVGQGRSGFMSRGQ